jgi:hypothetical protein
MVSILIRRWAIVDSLWGPRKWIEAVCSPATRSREGVRSIVGPSPRGGVGRARPFFGGIWRYLAGLITSDSLAPCKALHHLRLWHNPPAVHTFASFMKRTLHPMSGCKLPNLRHVSDGAIYSPRHTLPSRCNLGHCH